MIVLSQNFEQTKLVGQFTFCTDKCYTINEIFVKRTTEKCTHDVLVEFIFEGKIMQAFLTKERLIC